MPGPAFWAASAVSTKMPVPMMAPMPIMVSWKAPSERLRLFFSAVAMISSSGLMRQFMVGPPREVVPDCRGATRPTARVSDDRRTAAYAGRPDGAGSGQVV